MAHTRMFLCATIAFSVLGLQLQCDAVAVEDFFSYGLSVGDSVIENLDDANGPLNIPNDVSYPFFGRNSPSEVHVSV